MFQRGKGWKLCVGYRYIDFQAKCTCIQCGALFSRELKAWSTSTETVRRAILESSGDSYNLANQERYKCFVLLELVLDHGKRSSLNRGERRCAPTGMLRTVTIVLTLLSVSRTSISNIVDCFPVYLMDEFGSVSYCYIGKVLDDGHDDQIGVWTEMYETYRKVESALTSGW